MQNSRNSRSVNLRRFAMALLCVFLAIVLAVMVAATAFVEGILNSINRVDKSTQPTLSADQIASILGTEAGDGSTDFTGATMDATDVTWGSDVTDQIGGDGSGIINILLIGQDAREGETRARSDAMILCTFNKKTKTLTMTSFLRDLYVQIPGYRDHRLNSAYAVGGMSMLNDTLLENFGVHVDGNIEVDFNAFEEVVNILGGVEITLTSAEASYLNDTHGYTLKAGKNTLNGEQALNYARIRKIGMDFERTERQRNVLNAIIDSCKNMSTTQMLKLMNTILPMVTTDLTNAEITNYAVELFPMLAGANINTQRIPADGMYEFAKIDGMEIILPDLDANRQLLIDTLGG